LPVNRAALKRFLPVPRNLMLSLDVTKLIT
jgi:hypothetical protein